MKNDTETREGTMLVQTEYKEGKVVTDQSSEVERISVRKFRTDPAHVSVEFSRTRQPRPYESIKFSVQVILPCYVEEAEEAFDTAEGLAGTKMAELAKLMGF